jgi:uncharacterized integral membrane protein
MIFLRKLTNLLLILILVSYAGFFAFLNSDPIYINLPYFGEFKAPGSIAFVLTFVVGALFSALYFAMDAIRKSFEIRRNKKELSVLKRPMPSDNLEINKRRNKDDLPIYTDEKEFSPPSPNL